ncbi:hypothetical protein ACQ4LE_008065 [Meloidogyne hapla]
MEIVISNPHLDINEILKIKSNEYIQGFFNENMLNSSLINNMFNKLEQVIEYYNSLLNALQKDELNFINIKDNIVFKNNVIVDRLKDFNIIMDKENYNKLKNEWNNLPLSLINNISFEQMAELANKNVENLFSNENLKKLDDLYNVCKTVTQVERNIFIVWHLFALVQMLIHKFINFHGKINCYNKILKEYLSHYDNILLNIWHEKMKQNTRLLLENISVIKYVKAYDELEVKANNWMKIIRQLSILNKEHVVYEYKGNSFVRERMLMTLEYAEQIEGIVYPAEFKEIETKEEVEKLSSLFYTHSAVSTLDGLKLNEFYKILKVYYENKSNTFYEFFDKLNNETLIQLKLEQIIINPYLINEIHKEITSYKKRIYLLENSANFEDGKVRPLQKRFDIINEIINKCLMILANKDFGIFVNL